MQKPVTQPAAATSASRPFWVVMLAASVLVGAAMGLRQVMGLFLEPVTTGVKVGVEPFSNSMAIANLVWGAGSIVAGAVADKYGAGRVIVASLLATMAGLYWMATARTGLPIDLYVSGVLLGIGVSGTGVTALVGAIGRAAPANRRTQAIASLGMASGIGSLLAFPYTHLLMELLGWQATLLVLTGTAAVLLPLAWPMSGKPMANSQIKSQTLMEAFAEAFRLPSFWLLTGGFFVCGFHVTFYGVHLPKFVADNALPKWVGVAALTAVGVANIVGTYLAGRSGAFVAKHIGLSIIYFMRCFVFLGLLFLPINAWTVIGLSIMLGLFWLSTVPLTSTLVSTFFGTTWMSMLFGFVFFSHQLGSGLGLFLAGRLYDLHTGPAKDAYDAMWWISIALGLFAALVHLPIREKPVPRIVAQAAVAR
ncbi:MAG: MFS transporter [Hyphomicrobiaceae bacterium]|nr:MAG: MFS transporter [Hyphomicrobiaceae bacterium]